MLPLIKKKKVSKIYKYNISLNFKRNYIEYLLK